MEKLSVTYRKVADLIPYARNARTHSDEQVTHIASSIKEFGFTNPILTDGSNGVLAGHGRLMAAKKLGLSEVPTIDLAGLSEAQKKAYILADNKLALDAGWDDEMLKIELEDLKDSDLNLEELGLNFDDIAPPLDDSDVDFLDSFEEGYNVTIHCENAEQAKKLSDRLGLDLDLTRQVLRRDFQEITL